MKNIGKVFELKTQSERESELNNITKEEELVEIVHKRVTNLTKDLIATGKWYITGYTGKNYDISIYNKVKKPEEKVVLEGKINTGFVYTFNSLELEKFLSEYTFL